nr:unnamed protein product [Digitaria exilis]
MRGQVSEHSLIIENESSDDDDTHFAAAAATNGRSRAHDEEEDAGSDSDSSSSSSCATPRRGPCSSSTLAQPWPQSYSPTTSDEQRQQHEDTQKSSQYLLPSRKPSLQQIPEDQKPLVAAHEVSPNQNCSYTQGVMNGINVLCGVGILSTPYAIKQGGWIGLGILSLFALLAWYTGVLLRHCLDSKEGLETYPDIGHAAFGRTGRIVISVKSSSEYANTFYYA